MYRFKQNLNKKTGNAGFFILARIHLIAFSTIWHIRHVCLTVPGVFLALLYVHLARKILFVWLIEILLTVIIYLSTFIKNKF